MAGLWAGLVVEGDMNMREAGYSGCLFLFFFLPLALCALSFALHTREWRREVFSAVQVVVYLHGSHTSFMHPLACLLGDGDWPMGGRQRRQRQDDSASARPRLAKGELASMVYNG